MASTTRKIFSATIAVFSFFCISSYLFAQTITQTETVSVSAIIGSLPSIDPVSGGGGGHVYQSGVRFSGSAYPNATITVLRRDGDLISAVADDQGRFNLFVSEDNWQLFTLFATDTDGLKSTLLNFPTVLYSGYITDISGIKFAPTITTDKLSVEKGDFLSIQGSALANTQVEVVFDGEDGRSFTLTSDSKGKYTITMPISFPEGEYVVRAKYPQDGRTSKAVRVTVGSASILRNEATTNIPGDCNFDQRVTLVDFSVLAYWYSKKSPPRCVDANTDGIITLVDFSILAFYWNG